jgi:hypothetical protein
MYYGSKWLYNVVYIPHFGGDFDQTNWFEKIEPRQVKDSRRASATASAGLASSASCVWRHRGRGELEIGLGQFH